MGSRWPSAVSRSLFRSIWKLPCGSARQASLHPAAAPDGTLGSQRLKGSAVPFSIDCDRKTPGTNREDLRYWRISLGGSPITPRIAVWRRDPGSRLGVFFSFLTGPQPSDLSMTSAGNLVAGWGHIPLLLGASIPSGVGLFVRSPTSALWSRFHVHHRLGRSRHYCRNRDLGDQYLQRSCCDAAKDQPGLCRHRRSTEATPRPRPQSGRDR